MVSPPRNLRSRFGVHCVPREFPTVRAQKRSCPRNRKHMKQTFVAQPLSGKRAMMKTKEGSAAAPFTFALQFWVF